MGNSNPKPIKLSKLKREWPSTQTQLSIASSASNYSFSRRSVTRSSRFNLRDKNEDVSIDPSKTVWPVSVAEALFLPEFPVKGEVNEFSFQILETVAKGAFGRVVKVVKKDSGNIFAMKILSKAQIVKEKACQQCKDEVTIQMMCKNHPFIVSCRYFWQSRKRLFLVSEFISNGELLLLWKTYCQLPENVVRLYLAELAITIDYLHNTGVIYRDLKMENILLDNEGHIQLIDFGLAKWLSQGSRTRTICGTLQYMAPEVLRMEPYMHAADWWSLGIITYALLMGHYPIENVANHTVMSDLIMDFNFALPSDEFSAEVCHCVRRLLCKDPNRRLQSFYHLRWEPFMKGIDFDSILDKKISPLVVLKEELQNKKIIQNPLGNSMANHFVYNVDKFESSS